MSEQDSSPGAASTDGGQAEAEGTAATGISAAPPAADAPISVPLVAPAGENPNDKVSLPQFVSHKVVEAGRIESVLQVQAAADAPWDTGIRWMLATGSVIVVSRSLVARGAPAVGDYFVRYPPDNYESWSPAAKFEDGYTAAGDVSHDATSELPAGTALHLEASEGGGAMLHAVVDGEEQPSIAIPAGHRLLDFIHETFHHLLGEATAAVAPPSGEPAAEQVQAVSARPSMPIRTGSATYERPPVLRPGQQPTPQQAAMSPPGSVVAEGKPAPTGPVSRR